MIVEPTFQRVFEHPIDQKPAVCDQPNTVAQLEPIQVPSPQLHIAVLPMVAL
jgi:hypothetical protein